MKNINMKRHKSNENCLIVMLSILTLVKCLLVLVLICQLNVKVINV